MVAPELFALTLAGTALALSAQTAPPQPPPAFGPEFFLFLALMVVAFYFLILRPQKKEQEEKKKALDSLHKGDAVVSIGGIHGTIHEIRRDEGVVVVQVDKNVRLTFNLSAITPAAKPQASAPAEKDEKAKATAESRK